MLPVAWILIVFSFNGVATANFYTKDACMAAKEAVHTLATCVFSGAVERGDVK